MVWLIAFLGIVLSFFVKYAKRTAKEKSWSFTYWFKDNWPEVIASFLSMFILVIIFKQTEFDQSALVEKIPWVTSLPMDLVSAALAGYLNNTLWYAIVKKAKRK